MRIALITHQWPGVRLGGIGVYTLNCARGLALAGHEAHVFTLTLPPDARRNFPPGVFLHEVAVQDPQGLPATMPVSGELMYRRALSGILNATLMSMHSLKVCMHCEKLRFDIVEAPEYEALGEGFVRDLRDDHIPLVTQLHSGSAIARDVGNVANDAEQMLREAMELEVIAGSDGICAASQSVIDDTRRAYAMDDLAADAEVIPLPLDLPDVSFSLPDADAPVLYIGRLELLKGAHLLAAAAADFLRNRPHATLRIAGPDTMTAPDQDARRSRRSMAEWMRTRLGPDVAGRVTFLGEQTRTQLEHELRRCSFVVCPSLCESYSFVCCEAMAAGRPIVVSSGIGATQVVGPGGLAFVRGDAGDLARVMERMWDQPDLRAKLSQLAWERARTELSPERAIAQRIAFYQKVIERRKKEGDGPAKRRLEALPQVHSMRMLLAVGLRPGKSFDHMDDLMKAGGLEGKIVTPGSRLVEQLASRATGPGNGTHFHLYGAGRHTARLLMEKAWWEAQGHRVVGLIDDHPRYVEAPRAYGLPVLSLKVAERTLKAGDVIVLSTDAFEDQFWAQTAGLRAQGVAVYRLYS